MRGHTRCGERGRATTKNVTGAIFAIDSLRTFADTLLSIRIKEFNISQCCSTATEKSLLKCLQSSETAGKV